MKDSRGAVALLALLSLFPAAARGAPPVLNAPVPLKSAELLRRGASLSMIRSFLDLGRFYLAHGRPDRARQIVTYGLLHDPANADLLSVAAQAATRLDELDDALEFAAEALRQAPSSERSLAVERLRRLKLAAVRAAASPTATSSPPPAAPPKTAEATAPARPAASPGQSEGVLATKVRALHLATALESAIKGFNAGKKKQERMTAFSLDKLKAEHFLPEDFEVSSFKVSAVTSEGKVTLDSYGTVPELQAAAEAYEKATAEVSRLLTRNAGSLAEATFKLREMRQQFPKEPEVLDRLLFALREQRLWEDALKLVEEALKATPASVPLLYEHALLLLEAGQVERAAAEAGKLSTRAGAGVHGILAKELATLAKNGASGELERDLQSILSGSATPAETGAGGGK